MQMILLALADDVDKIAPMRLGSRTFSSRLIQGPLAGVSTAPFRALTWQHSKPAFCSSEMISCKSLLHLTASTRQRFLSIEPNEGPVCFQLSGNNPSELAEACKIVTQQGASLIDLNCGCPVKKIRRKGAGSSLLSQPALLSAMINAMKNSTHLPISIKIRVEGESDDPCNASITEVINNSGVDFVVVHGRHWTEHYETPCRHDQIRYFVDNLKVPVIGNGDIACPASLQRMLDTGCAGAMVARAGVGQPWLIEELQSALENRPFQRPSHTEIMQLFWQHIEALSTLLNSEKFALLHARKLAKYYARKLEQRDDFIVAVQQCDRLASLANLCENFQLA